MMRKEQLLKYPKGLNVALQFYWNSNLTKWTDEETKDVDWEAIESMSEDDFNTLLGECKSSQRIQDKYTTIDSVWAIFNK